MMDYEAFKEKVAEEIKDYLPDSYQDAKVEIHEVMKNNDIQLDGLTIKQKDSNVTPSIYLNDFFKEYEQGRPLDVIMEHIAEIHMDHENVPEFDVSMIMNYESAKEHIMPRLVNAEMNEQLLEQRPHVFESDLAVTFVVEVESTEQGIASVPITNDIMKAYGVDESELLQVAVQNMEEQHPATFQGMSETMLGIMAKEMDMDIAKGMMEELMPNGQEIMYVLSNDQGLNGAAAILSDKTMDMIAEQIGEDFYVLPSSVHEVLIVPDKGDLSREYLDEMVVTANADAVLLQDQLSDHAYMYSFESHELVKEEATYHAEQDLSNSKVNENSVAYMDDTPFVDGEEMVPVGESVLLDGNDERPKMEEITLKFGKGLVGEPFQGKDGNEYCSIKIPNKDENDKSPWASFVVKSNQVHEDKFGKGMWTKLPAEGSTTVRKDKVVGQDENGKNQYESEMTKVTNKELKGMVEFYKDNSKDQQKETVTIKCGKGLVGEPFKGKDGNEYCEVKIPNKDENDKSPWSTFVLKSNQIHEDKYGKGMFMKLPAEGSTKVNKSVVTGQDEQGKNIYANESRQVKNTELKEMVEFYKEKDQSRDEQSAPKKEEKQEEQASTKTSKTKEPSSLGERISKKKEKVEEKKNEEPQKEQTKSKSKNQER